MSNVKDRTGRDGSSMVQSTRVGGEDPEAVVPEPAGHEEPAVHGRDETVGTKSDLLTKVVAQVPSGQVAALIRYRRYKMTKKRLSLSHSKTSKWTKRVDLHRTGSMESGKFARAD